MTGFCPRHKAPKRPAVPHNNFAELRTPFDSGTTTPGNPLWLGHLRTLEAESIHIIREVAAEFQNPVMLYSIGKDSSCMVRLAQKAFYPGRIPFPLLHIDTTYKFREMIRFRDEFTASIGARLIVHTNTQAIAEGANPFKLALRSAVDY